MSHPNTASVERNGSDQSVADRESADEAELRERIDQLDAENRRLRRSVTEATQQQYRSTALGLLAVGVVCGLLGIVTPDGAVLFALSGVGLFSGVLTYYLTPNRVIPAELGERIYTATAGSYAEICRDLGLSDRRVYVPIPVAEESTSAASTDSDGEPTRAASAGPEQERTARLFVPQQATAELPDADRLTEGAFVVDAGTHGLSVQPTGGGLFEAFSAVLSEPLAETPEALSQQLSDAVVEEFELASSATADIDPEGGRMTVRFAEPLFDSHRQFDHPLVSFCAVGLAVGLDSPVETTVTNSAPLSVTFRWETDTERHRQTQQAADSQRTN